MELLDLKDIELIIGYKFNNIDLLKQAFTRKTYTEENAGEHNDVLEFYGDEALDYSISRLLFKLFGRIEDTNQGKCFVSKYDSGRLTNIKAYLVDSEMLAHRIDELDLAKYLIVGKGDSSSREKDSVKEDLFEAIIGAIDIDSNHNLQNVDASITKMLNPIRYIEEFDINGINYVDFIQQWNQNNYHKLPTYFEPNKDDIWTINLQLNINEDLKTFSGKGSTIKFAKRDACKNAYNYLKESRMLEKTIDLCEFIGDYNEENAPEKYSLLVDKGYIEEVAFVESKDPIIKDGKQIWSAESRVVPRGSNQEFKKEVLSTSKNKAKKAVKYAIVAALFSAAITITVNALTKNKKY